MKALQKEYSKTTILILWMLVTLPMFAGRFILMPYLVPKVSMHPGILYWMLMVAGMMWQFVLSVIILKLELGKLTLEKLKKRLWLNHPRTGNGKIVKRVYLLTIPIILYAILIEQVGFFDFIPENLARIFPFLAPPSYTQIQNLASPQFSGSWPLIILAVVSCIFNYLLGEELFFRGILLPKMGKAFGKWDWAVNGVLFAFYHLHKILEIPVMVVGSIFYGFLNKKYKSFWPAVIIHGVEGIPLLVAVIWVVFFM